MPARDELVDLLAGMELFASSSRGQLADLVDRAEVVECGPGDVLAEQHAPEDAFYVLLDGEVELRRSDGRREPFVQRSDYVGAWIGAGVLSGRPSTVTATTVAPSTLLRVDEPLFRTLLGQGYDIARHMLLGVADGVQLFEGILADQERLAALGKLSAGLAHELNNPAAAVARAADRLAARTEATHRALFEAHGGDRATFEATLAARGSSAGSSPLARSDAEDELADLLHDAGVADAEDRAVTFVDAGVPVAAVEAIVDRDPKLVGCVADAVEAVGLVDELRDATGRISELVASVRTYTHMDRASVAEIDVHDGLDKTVTMLGHDLKTLEVVRDYGDGVPAVTAQPGQLNQVWTNLLDNAAHAVGDGGTITIRTRRDGDQVVVAVHDTGPGIPDDRQRRVFDPFFTTKGVGEGTGMGLDVARRIVEVTHGGTLTVDSRPGDTTFTVRLPIDGSAAPGDPDGRRPA